MTPDNQQRVAMSQPYFAYAQQIVTRKETVGLEQHVEDSEGQSRRRAVRLRGRAVARASWAASICEELSRQCRSFRDLKVGRLEAVLLDLPIAIHYARPDPALKFSGEPFAPGYYAIGVLKQDATLLAAINQAIQQLAEDHTLERIYRKYGVWDERQEGLRDYRAGGSRRAQSHLDAARVAEVPAVAAARRRW